MTCAAAAAAAAAGDTTHYTPQFQLSARFFFSKKTNQ